MPKYKESEIPQLASRLVNAVVVAMLESSPQLKKVVSYAPTEVWEEVLSDMTAAAADVLDSILDKANAIE